MKGLETSFETKKEENICERQKIEAPSGFVSVFHETKEAFLAAINKEGLKGNSDAKNIGESKEMARRNEIIDEFRPEELRAKGISRNNIYAYPFLEHGHGLLGADQRFIKQDEAWLRTSFEDALEQRAWYAGFLEYWRQKGVNTADEYVRKMIDPEYLKSQYPGEIVEFKVDPQKCYVGDLEYITRIMDDMRRGFAEDEAAQQQAMEYWNNLITLDDFLKWYRKPEWTEDGNDIKDIDEYRDGEPLETSAFYPIKGTPNDFPQLIHQPEILIPEDIPQRHIKLVGMETM